MDRIIKHIATALLIALGTSTTLNTISAQTSGPTLEDDYGNYVGCTGPINLYTFDFTATGQNTLTQTGIGSENSQNECCNLPNNYGCVFYNVIVDEGATGVYFNVTGAGGNFDIYYDNCNTIYGVDDEICLDPDNAFTDPVTGELYHRFMNCRTGNTTYEIEIEQIVASVSPDVITNDGGCSAQFWTEGLDPSSVSWSSISPGTPGQYNNYLSCDDGSGTGTSGVPLTGCDAVTVTPDPGAPATIQYEVCGNSGGVCSSVSFCDTVEVTVVTALDVVINPVEPYLCYGDTYVTLTANVTGGLEPYEYTWSNGETTQSIDVSSGGTYSVSITDASGCAPTTDEVTVVEFTEPMTADAGPDLTVCESTSSGIDITGTVTGTTTGTWTGGNGTYTDNQDDLTLQYTLSATEIANGGVTLTLTTTNTGTCPIDSDEMTITVSELTASLAAQTNVSCFGGANGSAIIDATGGVEPYTYSLNGGVPQASNSFDNLTAGDYTVDVMDDAGCPGTVMFTITEPDLIQFSTTVQDASCFGSCDGEIDVDATGGTTPYQYSSNNGTTFQPSDVLTDLCAGTIGVVVQDANGCLVNQNIAVGEPTPLDATFTLVDPTCNGDCDGEITVNASGGTPGYQYSVNGGALQGSSTLTGLCAGDNEILIEDANGCQFTSIQTLTDPPTFGIDLIDMVESNCGFNNGSLEVEANGVNPPFTYSLDGGPQQTSGLFTNLTAGAYSIVATDANGCTAQAWFGVNDIEMDGELIDIGHVSCYGGSDGFVEVINNNGVDPITFELDNNGMTQTSGYFSGLSAGSHIVTIYDAGFCIFTIPFEITQPTEVDFELAITGVSCNGGGDGIVEVTSASGGTGTAYQYSMDGLFFQTDPQFTGLAAGTYTMYVMDENNCIVSDEFEVTEPTPVTFDFNASDLTCYQNATGEIQIAASGGTPGYQYSIDNGVTFQAGNSFFSLDAGTYDVVVEDANGCQDVQQVTLNEPAPLTATHDITNATCFGDCDGVIDVTASGGTSPYVYSIDNGVTLLTDPMITGLCAGDYTLQIFDANDCGVSSILTINEPAELIASATSIPSTCSDDNGEITASATGGTPGYEYSLDDVAYSANDNFTGLTAGAYTVYVQDVNGCPAQVDEIVENEPAPVISGLASSNATCNAACDGTIEITATGGTGTIQYSIDNGVTFQASNTFTGLCAGMYDITIMDDNNCVTNASSQVEITEPDVLDFTTETSDLTCYQNSSGTIEVFATGGTPGYQYSIDNGATFSANSWHGNLAAGTYDVVVQDVNGCSITHQVTLTEPTLVEITDLSATDATCYEYCNGTADVTAQGGTVAGDYSYFWYIVENSPDASNITDLCAGDYNSVVYDDNGCADTIPFTINEPVEFVIDSIVYTDPLCDNSCDGTITVYSSDAVEYSFDGGATFSADNTATGLCEGDYIIEVHNANDCIASDSSITLVDPEALLVATGTDTTICPGTDAFIYADATGGVGDYTYNWSNGATTQSQSVSPPGDVVYSVTVTDDNGCVSSGGDIEVLVYEDLSIEANNDTLICPNEPVQLNVNVLTGQPTYSYNWEEGGETISTATSTMVTPNETTVYSITVEDHCTSISEDVTVNVHVIPEVTFAAAEQEGCQPFEAVITPLLDPSLMGTNCTWTVSDGSTYTGCDGFTATFEEAGCYDVEYSGVSPEGCAMSGFSEEAFCVLPLPNVYFTHEPESPTYIDPEVYFTNLTLGDNTYNWTFEGYGSSMETNPYMVFDEAEAGDTIMACLYALAENGCENEICQPIVIQDAMLVYVPNAFTPDFNDYNQRFTPIITPDYPVSKYELLIFNRWGEVVFQTNDRHHGWDGTYRGEMMQDGVYSWKLSVTDARTQEQHDFVGHVSLLR